MKRGRSRLKHNNLCPDLILPPCFVLHAVGLAHLSLNHGLFIGAISSDCWGRSYDALDSSSLHPFFTLYSFICPYFMPLTFCAFSFRFTLLSFPSSSNHLWQMIDKWFDSLSLVLPEVSPC